MLTFEEARLNFKAIKICSFLNILPIEIDMKTGKIQKQSNKVRVLLWKMLFCFGIFHLLYVILRLVQMTILEPEKYFKWNDFVIHLVCTIMYTVYQFIGFQLFWKNPEECITIFNHLFEPGQNPVREIMDQENKRQQAKRKNQSQRQGSEKRTAEIAETEFTSASMSASVGVSFGPSSGEFYPGPTSGVHKNENTQAPRRRRRRRRLFTWPLEYSGDEILVKIIPVLLGFGLIRYTIIFALNPNRLLLLYSCLPPEYKNPFNFSALLAVDATCLAFVFQIGYFSTVVQFLFFSRCQLNLEQLKSQLRNLKDVFQNRPIRSQKTEIWILRQILNEMKQLVVFVELFNRCFPFCILAVKSFFLSLSIFGYFFTIRHFQDFPFVATMVAYIAFMCTLCYTFMYEHAFSIPLKMERLKNQFLLVAQKTASASTESSCADLTQNGNRNEQPRTKTPFWFEMKNEIGRIQNVGIRVGSFYQMERESTPNFVDFVFQNVVDLLVTFPRG